ncbi:ArsR family transcriptional regulator [Candidatus Woesearchaeota archaeon]|nr:ArsR family transcriptional regulator [Candidatus Woesearchaeota archaeon]
MERQMIKGISIIKNSEYRKKILLSLVDVNYLTPSEISEKTKLRLNHVSNFLKDLRDNELIICLNDDEKRGRLYQITGLGKKVAKENGN